VCAVDYHTAFASYYYSMYLFHNTCVSCILQALLISILEAAAAREVDGFEDTCSRGAQRKELRAVTMSSVIKMDRKRGRVYQRLPAVPSNSDGNGPWNVDRLFMGRWDSGTAHDIHRDRKKLGSF
jgi:hypothetical protein